MRANEAKYTELQTKARDAERIRWEYAHELDYRYQDRQYAPTAKRKRLEVLDRAAKRTADRFFAYLTAISPRNWDHGIPYNWIRDSLTFSDACTRDTLSVTPPPAYGYDARDMWRYCGPITEVQHVD